MQRTITAAALALTALAAPSFANEQLARSAGVAPGAYSLVELSLLREARQSSDDQRVRLILDQDVLASRRGDTLSPTIGTARETSAGRDQLAAALGVDAGDHGIGELARLHIDAHD